MNFPLPRDSCVCSHFGLSDPSTWEWFLCDQVDESSAPRHEFHPSFSAKPYLILIVQSVTTPPKPWEGLSGEMFLTAPVPQFFPFVQMLPAHKNLQHLNQKIYYLGFLHWLGGPVLSAVGCVLICCVLTAPEHPLWGSMSTFWAVPERKHRTRVNPISFPRIWRSLVSQEPHCFC